MHRAFLFSPGRTLTCSLSSHNLLSTLKTIGLALQKVQKLGVERKTPYALEHFVLGRSRLENPGCKAIAKAFEVG